MKINHLPFIAAGLALVLAGCATTPGTPQSVEERAQARWDALVENNEREAFEYYTPGFRELHDSRDFAYEMRRRPINWREATVLGADCEGDRCTVRTEIRYNTVGAPSGMDRITLDRRIEETWVRIENQWWYVPPDD